MKKESLLVVFYVLYFTWLLVITYISPQTSIINAFSIFVVLFYFLFLRVKGDIMYFWIGTILPALITVFTISGFSISVSLEKLSTLPFWIFIIWGTTFIALRRIYIIINK